MRMTELRMIMPAGQRQDAEHRDEAERLAVEQQAATTWMTPSGARTSTR